MNSIKKAIFLTGLLLGTSSFAATKDTDMQVTANVAVACYVTSQNMTFGNVDSDGTIATTTGQIRTICSRGLQYTMNLSTGSSSDFQARTMKNTQEESLIYNLYLDSNHTQIFGDGTNNTHNFPSVGNGGVGGIDLHGKLVKNQFTRAGQYVDNLTVTLDY